MVQSPSTLHKSVYLYLKDLIMNCDIKPGEHIEEKEIMEKTGCSKTPVREAIIRLKSENLVQVKSRYGAFAMPLTKQDVIEVYTLRKILEPEVAVRCLGWIDLRGIEKLNKSLEQLCVDSVKPAKDYEAIDIQFHNYFISHAGNKRLETFFKPVMQDAYRISMFNNLATGNAVATWQETVIHHKRILLALEEEDKTAIRSAYDYHLNFYLSQALDTLEAYDKGHNNI
jgi:DNA-binding GntR family transcriptional regulator